MAPPAKPVSGNNQGNLKGKSGAAQSLLPPFRASFQRPDRVDRGQRRKEPSMYAQHQDIRRRRDGSIDIDFHRQRSLMERRTRPSRERAMFPKTLITAGALAAVLIAASAPAPRADCPNCAGTTVASDTAPSGIKGKASARNGAGGNRASLPLVF